MGVRRQQGRDTQGDLFDEALAAALRHGTGGEGGTRAGAQVEPQAPTAWDQNRALTQHLMEEVASSANLNQAYKRVKANQGAPGVDGMSVADLRGWIGENRERLIAALLDGSYQPQPVRGVVIPKPGGGMRQLGIPSVVDRLVQQAILQVLEPRLDPTFSASSFGFRPGRGAHEALQQAREYVTQGYKVVVDIDPRLRGDRPGSLLRSREPRRADGPLGPAHWRQAAAAHCPALSGGRTDAAGRVRGTARGDATRRSPVAVAGQSSSG